MRIHTFDTSAVVVEKCAAAIVNTFFSIRDASLLFLYSGGSALSVLDRVAVELSHCDLRHVIFAPVDERNDPMNSNFCAFTQSFCYPLLLQQGATFFSPSLCLGSPRVVGEEYNKQITSFFHDIRQRSGFIISLLGIGSDGHIAGIFPFPDDCSFFDLLFESSHRFVVGYDVGARSQYPERITLTSYALRLVDFSFVYVCGFAKRDALLLSTTPGSLCECPARVLQYMRDVVVFTDIRL